MESEISRKELGTRTGEALVGDMPELAHIDIAIGQKGGPFETAFLTGLATPRMGHTALLAILAPNYAVKPTTLMVKTRFRLRAKRKLSLCLGLPKPR